MEKIIFKDSANELGTLLPINFSKIPFIPQRIFTVTGVPANTVRGKHAHKKTIQFLVCLKGAVDVAITADGEESEEVTLYKNEGVLIDKMVWACQRYYDYNTILLVLASTEYTADDYITSIDEFRKELSVLMNP